MSRRKLRELLWGALMLFILLLVCLFPRIFVNACTHVGMMFGRKIAKGLPNPVVPPEKQAR